MSEQKPVLVRYEAVNPLLLNEFQKQHQHEADQDKIIAQQKAGFANQRRLLQSLAAQLDHMEQAQLPAR